MAVVEYQCTVCKRTINLIQNKQGLDHIGNCNITLGCRGQLQQQEVYLDYIRGSLPADVVGLKNWVQRQVLYNFTQTVDRQNWVITHNLGTLPLVQVFVNTPTSTNPDAQTEILPTDIIYNSDDQLTLILSRAYTGIAQLIARASNPDILNPRPRPAPVTAAPTLQLTNAGEITIATRASSTGTATLLPVNFQYTASDGNVVDVGYIATNIPSDTSPWADTTRIMFMGKVYLVRTFNIQTGSGTVTNGSSVQLASLNSTGQLTFAVIATDIPGNAFEVSDDYSLYFFPGSEFTTTNTNPLWNNVIWNVASSSYDPITNITSIVPTGTVTNTFLLPASTIVQPGVRQIVPGEVIILLGSSPFTIYDKIVNSYVDFTAVDTTATMFDLYFNAGDMFAETSIVENIYPPIRSV